MKDAAGAKGGGRKERRVGGVEKSEGEDRRIGGWEDRRPTERRNKALTPQPGCILAGRQLWIGNITAAGN